MQISVRSYLTAGTVAVVGAGAIALTPVLPATGLSMIPAPAVAEVTLTGLGVSLTDVVNLLQTFGVAGGLPDVFTALQSLLPTDVVSAVVNEFVNQASPLVLAAAGEVFDYVGTAVTGLISGPDSIPVRFGDALSAIPATLLSAVGSLGTGDLATALQTITDGLSGPAAGITAALTEAGAAFQTFLTAEFTGLVGALPGVLLSAVQTVIVTNVQSLIDTITGAFTGLFGGLIPGAGAAVVAVADTPTIVCNMPAIRTSAESPAIASVPAAAEASVAVAVSAERPGSAAAAESVAPRRVSAPGVRSDHAKPAATAVAADVVEPAAAAPASRSAAGKAGADRGARLSGR